MKFVKKSVRHMDLGERLRMQREKLGLSLEDIRRLGKIQPKYLEALESGTMADLPATVYVKGFLRTLAQIYRVPAEPLLEAFVEERAIRDNVAPARPLPAPQQPLAIPKLVLNPRIITLFGVAVLGILSLGYLYFQISSLARPPRLELLPPLEKTVSTGLLQVAGRTERGATVYLNNQALAVDASGNFSEALSLGFGKNLLAIRAVNKFGQETVLQKEIIYAEKEIAGAATTTARVVLEVTIETRGTFIEVLADGRAIFSGELAAGSSKTFTAVEQLLFSTRDAGATRATLNGQPLGTLGRAGEPLLNIEFTK